MADETFSTDDCAHYDDTEGICKIRKGCGSGGVYCRPVWTNTKCYTQEKPNNEQLAAFGQQIYAHGATLVIRGKDGKCWQLTCGDYMGVLPEKELIFVKKAILSD